MSFAPVVVYPYSLQKQELLSQSGEVVALVERAKRGEAKPATVFGA